MAGTAMPIIEVTGLDDCYGTTVALDDLELQVAQRTVFGLLRPDGADKTTTVRILATLARPDAGTVTVAGHMLAASGIYAEPLTASKPSLDEVFLARQELSSLTRPTENERESQ
jgi:ABC-type multidrug transport system ATPase subunit